MHRTLKCRIRRLRARIRHRTDPSAALAQLLPVGRALIVGMAALSAALFLASPLFRSIALPFVMLGALAGGVALALRMIGKRRRRDPVDLT